MTKAPRVITLLSDFGSKDPFVGVMKGVIASIAPEARVVDLCHEVEPFAVSQARFLLRQSWPYFPPGTIHVCVVDPGVGSSRRALLVEAGSHRFVGPDNGLLGDVVGLERARVRLLSNPKYHLRQVSRTFHGRDVFAPVAAHLAAGVAAAKLGPRVEDALRSTTGEPLRTGKRFWQGEVAHIDRFGNLITNLDAAEMLARVERRLVLRVGFRELDCVVESYAEAPRGEPVVLVGSAGTLEVAVNQGSAAQALGVGVGAPVELEIR